jgi:hypothetical protein
MATLALAMWQNKTAVFFLSVYQSDGVTPQSLVGSTLWFHAAVKAFVINKSSPGLGITIQNTAGGLNCATLQIEPGDTAVLVIGQGGALVMPCELTLQNGLEEYELAAGSLSITPNVGTP